MNRRNFIVNSSWTLFSAATWERLSIEGKQEIPRGLQPGRNLVEALVEENDHGVKALLDRQQTQEGHPFWGGIPNQQELYHAMSAAVFLQRAASAFIEPASVYYQSSELLKGVSKALSFLNRIQHEDGTIDLLTTNFHSPPDTAFVVEPMALGYALIEEKMPEENREPLLLPWKSFLMKAGAALSVGGIHTPNHRWVVCMALARLNSLFPQTKYVTRIEEWLAEGIDIDPDGQYTEKSSHIYSPLTNRCLITVARLLDREDLLEPVRQNLEMTLYYLHPDGSVVTEASRRQDQYQRGSLQQYVYPYRYMAIKEQNGRFSAISQAVAQELTLPQLVRNLGYFQEDILLNQDLPKSEPLPTNFVQNFPHSQLVRVRREKWDATLLANNESFFTFQVGKARILALRVACAFFGKGQFSSPDIQQEGETYTLTQTLTGPYYQPFPKEQVSGDGVWENLPRTQRNRSEVQELRASIQIEEYEEGFRIHYDWSGTENIPIALEIGFPKEGKLRGISSLPHEEDSFLLEDGMGTYQVGEDQISFGPGRSSHSYVHIRGSLPKLPGNSVYLTGYTPFRGVLEIQAPSK